MSLLRPTRDEVERYALSLQGMSRDRLPVPWTASPTMDDCAAFVSSALWGGTPGPILWVDNFKSAGDGTYAAGAGDLLPWDVLLFDWEGNGVGNHVEFMVANLGGGFVRTYGANGSDTRAAAYRTRPVRYIMGRFRPAWASVTPPVPPRPSKPATPRRRNMYTLIPIDNTVFLYNTLTRKRKAIASPDHRKIISRYLDNDGSDRMLQIEVDIVQNIYLKAVR